MGKNINISINLGKGGGLLYMLCGLYTVMINFHYNHSIFYAILSWMFWPFVLVYNLIVDNLSHGMWHIIPSTYF